MGIALEDKRKFLHWLSETVNFPRREVYWILNYLLNHDIILEQTHIVEHAEQTPRGILLSGIDETIEPLSLYLQGHLFQDPAQVFHEIRFNWNQPLYLECHFLNPWKNIFYLAVLEDNPFDSWNQRLPKDIEQTLEAYLELESLQAEIRQLYSEADVALEGKDHDELINISQRLILLEKQKKELAVLSELRHNYSAPF